ncbi:hypothetical protein J7I98_17810 [Streptomyces sp. ISL-98]|uniref:DUF6281 family protein n=1 Tax=Streptomyces sp. ISL-98 TaxID=2819192 RepID=UPI001BE9CB7E|nr:DUF6281 family protein [Streptomyces sp. ISL-98]MBT2507703.1 hypothetical protein [Streptomyces sp. ISL-98]
MRAAFPVGRGRSVRMLLVTAAAVALAVGCTSPGGGSGNSASCAYRVTYEDRTYQDVANVDFTIGETLGAVSSAPCDDTPGQNEGAESAAASTAYAVEGLDTDIAIAVGDTPGEAVFFAVDSGKKLPAEVRKLIDGS